MSALPNKPTDPDAAALIRCTDLLGVMVPNQNQNAEVLSNDSHVDSAESSEQRKCCLPGVEGFLHRLRSCPDELRDWAKTDRNVAAYEALLNQWQSDGCPNPERWQHPNMYLIFEAWNSCDHGVDVNVTPNQ
jgi:hypothetical protein